MKGYTYRRGIISRPTEDSTGLLPVPLEVLVRVQHCSRPVVGLCVLLRIWVADPFDVRLLAVGLVEEDAVADARLLGQDGPGPDAAVLHVEGGHDLAGRKVGFTGLAARDIKNQEAVFDVDV